MGIVSSSDLTGTVLKNRMGYSWRDAFLILRYLLAGNAVGLRKLELGHFRQVNPSP